MGSTAGTVTAGTVTAAMNAAIGSADPNALGAAAAAGVVILTLPPLAVVLMMVVVVMMFPLTSRRGRRTRRLDVLTDDSIICHSRLAVKQNAPRPNALGQESRSRRTHPIRGDP